MWVGHIGSNSFSPTRAFRWWCLSWYFDCNPMNSSKPDHSVKSFLDTGVICCITIDYQYPIHMYTCSLGHQWHPCCWILWILFSLHFICFATALNTEVDHVFLLFENILWNISSIKFQGFINPILLLTFPEVIMMSFCSLLFFEFGIIMFI